MIRMIGRVQHELGKARGDADLYADAGAWMMEFYDRHAQAGAEPAGPDQWQADEEEAVTALARSAGRAQDRPRSRGRAGHAAYRLDRTRPGTGLGANARNSQPELRKLGGSRSYSSWPLRRHRLAKGERRHGSGRLQPGASRVGARPCSVP